MKPNGKATCLEIVAAAGLGEGQSRGVELYFNCNQHDDSRASLRIHPEKDVWKCDPCNVGGTPYRLMAHLAGCDPADKRSVLEWRDAHGLGHSSQNNGSKPTTTKRIVAVYDYGDESGQLCHQTVRYQPKDFLQRRPDGKGGWIWKLNGVRTVLYRLKDFLAADPSATIYIVEGEKDVDAIYQRGGIATTNPMGAGKWRDDYADFLRGRNVVVIPDNDEPGRKHAQTVANSLRRHGVGSVKILDLPDMARNGDVSNFFNSGDTMEQ